MPNLFRLSNFPSHFFWKYRCFYIILVEIRHSIFVSFICFSINSMYGINRMKDSLICSVICSSIVFHCK